VRCGDAVSKAAAAAGAEAEQKREKSISELDAGRWRSKYALLERRAAQLQAELDASHASVAAAAAAAAERAAAEAAAAKGTIDVLRARLRAATTHDAHVLSARLRQQVSALQASLAAGKRRDAAAVVAADVAATSLKNAHAEIAAGAEREKQNAATISELEATVDSYVHVRAYLTHLLKKSYRRVRRLRINNSTYKGNVMWRHSNSFCACARTQISLSLILILCAMQ
jgi:hypothetical protein